MRPAQKAPENFQVYIIFIYFCNGFNEAGAKSAGKPCSLAVAHLQFSGFNEAGAKSAGKLRRKRADRRLPKRLQ